MLQQFKENGISSKIGVLFNFRQAVFVPLCFCCFLGQYSSETWLLGVFRNPQDLLLMMGTEILKIDAEMAKKIEVGVGNFTTEIIFLLFCQFLNEPHWTSKSIGFHKGWLYLHYLLRPRDATASKKGLESSWYQLSWMLHVNVM